MAEAPKDVTTLLRLAAAGDRRAQDELFRLVEGELRHRARARLGREDADPLLQTTVLVDEAFLKLVGDPAMNWEGRSQFYRYAAKVMRQVLVDEARQRNAQKRGGGERPAPLDRVLDPVDRRALDPPLLLAVHDGLARLAGEHPDLIELVELHVFGGWELKQIAEEVLRVGPGVVKRKWRLARALLQREMSKGDEGG